MATGLVIHISSGEDRHTEILTDDNLRIGTNESCDLRLRSSSVPKGAANGLLLEFARANGNAYRLVDFDQTLPLVLNNEPLEPGTEIRDGDEMRVEGSDLLLHFFPVRDLPAVIPPATQTHVAPFIEAAAIESAATARRDDAKVFLREFTRELVREINPSTKLVTLAIAVALVGGVLYLGFAMYKELQ